MEAVTSPSLIALGETMVLVTPARPESLADAVEFRLDAAGAESNVASHASVLGIDAAWVSALGADPLGDRVCETLRSRGVDLRWVLRDETAPTGVYVKNPGEGVHYYRAGSAASRLDLDAVREVPFEEAGIVHLSGITPALSSTCAHLVDGLLERLRDADTLVSFDVNHRASLWEAGAAAPTLKALARRADIVFVGLDEAEGLWGCSTPEEVRALLPEPQRLVVKDGDVGATEFYGDSIVFEPAIRTEVVEAVGAGDAFAAGYLAAELQGLEATERLRSGHRRAHLVLQSTSDFVSDEKED